MGVRAVLLALLAGLLALGSGYVILPGMHMFYEPDDPSSEMSGPNNPFSLKWSMAQNNSYDYGLNGGIAFVFSPEFDTFCKQRATLFDTILGVDTFSILFAKHVRHFFDTIVGVDTCSIT